MTNRGRQPDRASILRQYADVLSKNHGRYVFWEVLVPIVVASVGFVFNIRVSNADIIVSALGVLGGLLFAHAIFVFDLRMNYMHVIEERLKQGDADGENLTVPMLIDDMFSGVVYSSALSLSVTMLTALASSYGWYGMLCDELQRIVSAMFIGVMAHLAACIWRVLKLTSNAYGLWRRGHFSE